MDWVLPRPSHQLHAEACDQARHHDALSTLAANKRERTSVLLSAADVRHAWPNGRNGMETAPSTTITIARTVAKIGRPIKNALKMTPPQAPMSGAVTRPAHVIAPSDHSVTDAMKQTKKWARRTDELRNSRADDKVKKGLATRTGVPQANMQITQLFSLELLTPCTAR